MQPLPLSESPNLVDLAPGVRVRSADLRYSFSRSGGPGGQAVNKLNTQAELRVAVTDITGLPDDAAARLRRMAGRRLTQADEIVLSASTSRSQLENRRAALERLRDLVTRAIVKPKPRRPTRPTKGARERRLKHKRELGEKKRRRGRTDE